MRFGGVSHEDAPMAAITGSGRPPNHSTWSIRWVPGVDRADPDKRMMMEAFRCWPRDAFPLGLRKPPAGIEPRATTAHSAALHHRGHVCSRHAITQTTAFSATKVPVPFLRRQVSRLPAQYCRSTHRPMTGRRGLSESGSPREGIPARTRLYRYDSPCNCPGIASPRAGLRAPCRWPH